MAEVKRGRSDGRNGKYSRDQESIIDIITLENRPCLFLMIEESLV
jgi:hypothetical protein